MKGNKAFQVNHIIVNILTVIAIIFVSWVFASVGEVMVKENEPLNEANFFEITCNLNAELKEKNYRQMTGTILEKNVLVTDDGEMWTAWVPDLDDGTRVLITFDGKSTPQYEDDEIVRVERLWTEKR